MCACVSYTKVTTKTFKYLLFFIQIHVTTKDKPDILLIGSVITNNMFLFTCTTIILAKQIETSDLIMYNDTLSHCHSNSMTLSSVTNVKRFNHRMPARKHYPLFGW